MDALDPEAGFVGEEELALDELTGSLGFLTRAAYLQIGDLIRNSGALAVSPPTLSMLVLIRANPGIRQVQAARILLVRESNMAILVRELVGKGLIERRRIRGKRSGLWITEEGQHIVAQAVQANSINREYADMLTDDEYEQLVSLLARAYLARL